MTAPPDSSNLFLSGGRKEDDAISNDSESNVEIRWREWWNSTSHWGYDFSDKYLDSRVSNFENELLGKPSSFKNILTRCKKEWLYDGKYNRWRTTSLNLSRLTSDSTLISTSYNHTKLAKQKFVNSTTVLFNKIADLLFPETEHLKFFNNLGAHNLSDDPEWLDICCASPNHRSLNFSFSREVAVDDTISGGIAQGVKKGMLHPFLRHVKKLRSANPSVRFVDMFHFRDGFDHVGLFSFDAAGVRTVTFNPHQSPLKLIAMIARLTDPSLSRRDPTFVMEHQFHLRTRSGSIESFRWVDKNPTPIFATDRNFDDVSSVWEGTVQKLQSSEDELGATSEQRVYRVVCKDVWRTQSAEGRIVENLNSRGIVGVPQFLSHGVVILDDGAEENLLRVRSMQSECKQPYRLEASIFTKSFHSIARFRYLMLSCGGKRLEKSNTLEIVEAVRDATRTIWAAWKHAQTKHRDISWNNIIVPELHRHDPHLVKRLQDTDELELPPILAGNDESKGAPYDLRLMAQIIDWGSAVDQNSPEASQNINWYTTYPFLSLAQISNSVFARKNLHMLGDELESLFYVLMWALAKSDGHRDSTSSNKGKDKRRHFWDSALDKWMRRDDAYRIKQRMMSLDGMEYFQQVVGRELGDELGGLLVRLRRALLQTDVDEKSWRNLRFKSNKEWKPSFERFVVELNRTARRLSSSETIRIIKTPDIERSRSLLGSSYPTGLPNPSRGITACSEEFKGKAMVARKRKRSDRTDACREKKRRRTMVH